jgi:hypothetical protein
MDLTLKHGNAKIVALAIMALALGVSAWLVGVTNSEASTGTSVTVQSRTIAVNTTTTTLVRLNALAAGDSVNSYDITLTFNPAVVSATGVTAVAAEWGTLAPTPVIDNAAGTVRLAALRQPVGASCTAACDLFTVSWQAKPLGGTSPIALAASSQLAGKNAATSGGVLVTFASTAGTISVTGGATPTNTVAAATPTRTATPAPATATPTRTATPVPATATPTRTATPKPATATPTRTATPVPGGWGIRPASTQATASRGTSVSLPISVTSSKAMRALVDIEVHDAAGAKVFQQFYDNRSFVAGVPVNFSPAWAIPSGAAKGTYTVKVGVFSAGWGALYVWNNSTMTVTVR